MTVHTHRPIPPAAVAPSARDRVDFVRTVAWLLSDQVLQTLLTVGVGVVVARKLGPSGLGDLSFALATLALLVPLVVSHRQLLLRDLIVEPEARAEILGTGAAVGLVSALGAAALAVGFALVSGRDSTTEIAMVIAVTSLLGLAIGSWETALQADHRAGELVFVRSGSAIVGAGLKIAVVLGGFGVIGFVSASTAQTFLAAIVCVVLLRRGAAGRVLWHVDRRRFSRLVRESWPFAISALSIAVYMTLDQVMLGVLSNDHAVGIYAAAVRVSESTLLLPMVILASATPVLTRMHRTNPALYRAQTQRLVNALTAAGLLLAVLGGALAKVVVGVLYGEAFHSSAGLLAALLVANIFVFQGIAGSMWIVNEGLQRAYMLRTLTGAAINVGLNLVLIPRYGAIGAAWATLIAYAYAGLLGTALDRRTRPLAVMLVRGFAPRSVYRAIRVDIPMLVRSAGPTRTPDQGTGS